MRHNKLKRFEETAGFSNFVQTQEYFFSADHPYKGRWGELFFKNTNPIVLELGCGKGEYTVGLAPRFPNRNFIGCDIKGARMWRGAKRALENNLNNVGFLRTHIGQIEQFFGSEEVSEIWITFPDPQPQKPRVRKRLTSPDFLERYKKFLKKDAIIHLKTDNVPFFDYTLDVIKNHGHLLHFHTCDLYACGIDNETTQIQTHYESLFREQGMKINYLNFSLK